MLKNKFVKIKIKIDLTHKVNNLPLFDFDKLILSLIIISIK